MNISFLATQLNVLFDGKTITMQKFIKGTTTTVSVEFVSPARALVDPTAVSLAYKLPDLTTEVVAAEDITNPSVGLYQSVIELTQEGKYIFRWVGTGANGGVQEKDIWVFASQVV